MDLGELAAERRDADGVLEQAAGVRVVAVRRRRIRAQWRLRERSGHDAAQRLVVDLGDQELEKAKNARLVEFYREVRTINGRANTIGTYEVFMGDYNKLFDAAKSYSAVTKEDVQRVARKYFGPNNRTVATLLPENDEKAKQ